MASIIAFIPAQKVSFIPIWFTPIWILAMGVLFGLVASVVVYAVLGGFSFIPALGSLADNRRRASIVALVLSATVAAAGILRYIVFAGPDSENTGYLVLPWVCLGLIAGWGLVYGVWNRTIRELPQILSEGVLGHVLVALGSFALLGVCITPLVTERSSIVASFPEVLKPEKWVKTVELEKMSTDIAPDQAPFQKVTGFAYDPDKMTEVTVESDRTIVIADAEKPADFKMSPQRIEVGSVVQWRRDRETYEMATVLPLPPDPSNGVYFQNREIENATVKITVISKPEVPEAWTIWVTGMTVFILICTLVTLRQAAPQVSAVALATAKSEMAQPLYITLLLLTAFVIGIMIWVPFNTLGEDIKVLKDSGMTLIMIVSIVHAVWAAGTSVSEEIEGRTALTVLSKPISRRSFLLGKYVGIMGTVLLMFVILGLLLMVVTAYKPIYDGRENSSGMPAWQQCHIEMVTTTPGLFLLFMETTLIAGISVAIATRLPMIANFIICFTIYVIGNITAPIVRASADDNELVRFVGRLIAVVFPNLNSFNVQAAVDAGNPIPTIYLAGAFTYLLCFGVMIAVVGLLMFEDRDLA